MKVVLKGKSYGGTPVEKVMTKVERGRKTWLIDDRGKWLLLDGDSVGNLNKGKIVTSFIPTYTDVTLEEFDEATGPWVKSRGLVKLMEEAKAKGLTVKEDSNSVTITVMKGRELDGVRIFPDNSAIRVDFPLEATTKIRTFKEMRWILGLF